jgi:hypothetical protein
MNKLKQPRLIGSTIFIGVIIFFIPFLIKSKNDNLISTLSLSFTAVGAMATVATLIIAIILYDRFGLESKFVENQTNKVLELANLLKGRTIVVKGEKFDYFIRPSREQLLHLDEIPFYQNDRKKKVLISSNDFSTFEKDLIAIRRSYWLPNDIKESLAFIEIYGLLKVENPLDKQYVQMDFGSKTEKTWMLTLPEMTFEKFNSNLHDLVKSIEDWLDNYSNIKIDLRLEEPN